MRPPPPAPLQASNSRRGTADAVWTSQPERLEILSASPLVSDGLSDPTGRLGPFNRCPAGKRDHAEKQREALPKLADSGDSMPGAPKVWLGRGCVREVGERVDPQLRLAFRARRSDVFSRTPFDAISKQNSFGKCRPPGLAAFFILDHCQRSGALLKHGTGCGQSGSLW